MTDATLYTSMDPGAPPRDLQPNANTNAVQFWHTLLVPCLVTGYGVAPNRKEGQGWELVHADLPRGFTLKAPDGVFYVWCEGLSQTNKGSAMCTMWMAESLTAPFSYPPVGDNVRSGSHSPNFAPSSNRSWISGADSGYAPIAWYVLAKGSKVVVHLAVKDGLMSTSGGSSSAGGTGADYIYGSKGGGGTVFFGNIIPRDPLLPLSGPQNSCVIGCLGWTAATYNPSSNTTFSYLNTYMPGDNMRLRDWRSGAVETGLMPSFNARPNKYVPDERIKGPMDVYPPDLIVERADVFEEGLGSVGYLPGAMYMRRYGTVHFPKFMVALGRSGVLQDSLVPVMVEGEPFYVFPSAFGTAAFSLLEKYWT